MEVRIKIVDGGTMPCRAHVDDAGFDCYARTCELLTETMQVRYNLGFCIEIPEGHVGLVFPRSSVCRQDLQMSNSVGVIDSGYRGEVSAVFNLVAIRGDEKIRMYDRGDRVAQLIIIPYPEVRLVESDTLSETERGKGGYGSTGK